MRQRALAAAERARLQDETEQRAARRRILDMATTALPVIPPAERMAPLLTRGQAARTSR
jgi:hypothetical protein